MVFQHPNVLPMSIENNIAMPLATIHGVKREDAMEAARQALEEAQLWDEVRDRHLASDACALSGGQQQRLCLARALAIATASCCWTTIILIPGLQGRQRHRGTA